MAINNAVFPYPEFDMFDCFEYCKDVWTIHDYDHGEIIIAGSYYECKAWPFGQHYAEWVITHKTHGDIAKMYKLKPDAHGYYSWEPIHPLFKLIPRSKLNQEYGQQDVWFFPEGLRKEDIAFKRLPVGEHWEKYGKWEAEDDTDEEEYEDNKPVKRPVKRPDKNEDSDFWEIIEKTYRSTSALHSLKRIHIFMESRCITPLVLSKFTKLPIEEIQVMLSDKADSIPLQTRKFVYASCVLMTSEDINKIKRNTTDE